MKLRMEDKNNITEGELSIVNAHLKEYSNLENLLRINIIELDKHCKRLDTTLSNIETTLQRLENLENKTFNKIDFIGRTLGF